MAATGKNTTKIWLLVIVAIIGLLVVFYLFSGERYRWNESYKPYDDQPYGTMVFYRLMRDVRSGQQFVMVKDSAFKELPADPTTEVDNYVYIGHQFFPNEDDTRRLLEFVAAGNHAYIMSDYPESSLADTLLQVMNRQPELSEFEQAWMKDYYENSEEESDEYDEYDEEYEDEYQEQQDESDIENFTQINNASLYNLSFGIHDTLVSMKLNMDAASSMPAFNLSKYVHFERTTKMWQYFNDSLGTRDNKPVNIMGHFNDEYVNYIMCEHGLGKVYFHSTPLIFTNFNMVNDTAMNYCRMAMADMGKGHVYWDEDNRDYDIAQQEPSQKDLTKPDEGPMEFILSEPMLKTAWYLLLAAGLLYLMFGAKRRQRIIPSADNMENTSIEYTEVISQMFMRQSDHKKLVKMKMDLFRAYLRDRLNLKLPAAMADEDEALYLQIARKSNVTETLVKDIFEQNKYLSSIVVVETPDMLRFHHTLEKFYELCK
ncbi:MAG: DUF4350 domain-containing protein [Flavobacteriales bacterium]